MPDLHEGLRLHEDGTVRCWWCGDDPTYVAYHDDDWGTPIHDDRALFELLCLEGFQAGLSWITILRKRPAFRAGFDGFDLERVAGYDEPDIERLLGDAGIVRHRGKIEATIANARATLALHGAGRTLAELVWTMGAAPAGRARPSSIGEIPGASPEATVLSKELKKLGFRFVGPTTVYAFLQSAGVVDDHLVGCFRADG
jgi:DNA-3-methyladenine glycosylase I